MVFPNYIVGGVQKGGTTSLHAYLAQHPQVCVAKKKELNFFNSQWDKGTQWYSMHFRHCLGARAIGETSPLYLWNREVPGRMKRALPRIKLIFLLRNPTDRAFSNYLFNISRLAWDPFEPFHEAIHTDKGQRHLVSKGFYSSQLRGFFRHFSQEQIRLFASERLKTDPDPVLSECYSFIGTDAHFQADTRILYNETKVPDSLSLKLLLRLLWVLRLHEKKLLVRQVIKLGKKLGLRLRHISLLAGHQPVLDSESREYLDDLYAPSIEELRAEFEFDVSDWLS